jgi:hypothetical protein
MERKVTKATGVAAGGGDSGGSGSGKRRRSSIMRLLGRRDSESAS